MTPADAITTKANTTAICWPAASPTSAISAAAATVSSMFFGFAGGQRKAGSGGLRDGEVVDRTHPARRRHLFGRARTAAQLLDRQRQDEQAEAE